MHTNGSSPTIPKRPLLMALLLLGLTAPAVAHAGPIVWSLSGGRYDALAGTDQPYFAGLGARLGVGQFALAPNAEWLFVEDAKVYTLNLDATMVIVPTGAASVWIGGGLCYRTVDTELGEAVKERGTNLLIGAGTSLPLKPYAQAKWVLEDDNSPFALSVVIRFSRRSARPLQPEPGTDVDCLAGDTARLRGGQEHGRRGNLFGLDHALEGARLDEEVSLDLGGRLAERRGAVPDH
jgi:hypothetical protein